MPRKKTPKKVYDFLVLEVSSYSVMVDAAINYNAKDKRFQHDDVLVYSFNSLLTIECRLKWPEDRSKDMFSLSIYGWEANDPSLALTLKDCQAQNADGSKKYLKKRDRYVPVYDVPKGVGILDKVRGENRWTGTAWVSPQCLNDMLVLAANIKRLYVCIHEMKEGRRRWISGLTLRTDDPEDE